MQIIIEDIYQSWLTQINSTILQTILRTLNIIQKLDEFEGNEIIALNGDFLDYRGFYNEMHEKYRPKGGEAVNINDDHVFEIELMKSIEINIA